MRVPLLLLLALVASAQDPDSSSPSAGSAGEESPTAGDEPGAPTHVEQSAGSSPATSAPQGDGLPAPAAKTGAEVLAEATQALGEQRFQDALEIAIPGIRAYPDLAQSFEALALLATDQLGRQAERLGPEPIPVTAVPASETWREPAPTGPSPGAYPVRGIGVPAYQGPPSWTPYPYERRRAHFGVDLGLPTGVRVEWKARNPDAVVSGGGLRLGVNAMAYYGLYGGYDIMGYADVTAAENWEVELVGGVTAYSGIYPWPMVGAALQYDPEGPLQVNVGGRIGLYRAFSPDIGVGFLW